MVQGEIDRDGTRNVVADQNAPIDSQLSEYRTEFGLALSGPEGGLLAPLGLSEAGEVQNHHAPWGYERDDALIDPRIVRKPMHGDYG